MSRGSRGRRRREGGLPGRVVRVGFVCLLMVVVIIFAASALGLLGQHPRVGRPSAQATGAGPGTAHLAPAVLDGQPFERGPMPEPGRGTGDDPDRQVRVFVSNGSGAAGLAARMREELRGAGFDVCGIASADQSDYAETIVIDRGGERWKAEAVRDYLRAHFGVGRLVLQVRNSPETDVLVVLGSDLPERVAAASVSP
jgi:hypothetical protein